MRPVFGSLPSLLLMPILVCVLLAGCSDEGFKKERRKGKGPGPTDGVAVQKDDEPPTELESTGWGKVTGKFINPAAPKPMILTKLAEHDNRGVCLAGTMQEKQDQTWIVGKDGGVANVVVWVTPPKLSKFFKIKDELKEPTGVKLEQPHCAFIPHVVGVFTKYQTKSGWKSTGQKVEVVNDSTISHNFKTSKTNFQMAPGDSKAFAFEPDFEPVRAECSIHGWMNAYIWAFDHPYFAVTRDDGVFEFVVPAGVELNVMAWHEERKTWEVKQKITVQDGETLNLDTISAK